MQQKESYDVLRLIEHGQICYISSENVQGRTLARYLKYHPVMEKKKMFLLLKAIAEQLELIHRCRGNPCYQYVNPYSIILAEDGRVYFLDMKAETNRKQVVFMQRRDMREYFLPPEENYYQNASKELDIYGLGKTFQYILASSETEPHLNRWEEHRLQSIISKTMGTKGSYYQSVSEIQKQIPKWKEKVNKESSGDKGKRRWKIYIALFFAVVAAGYMLIQQRKNVPDGIIKEQQKATSNANTELRTDSRENEKRDEEYLELALAYFLNVGNVEKSRICLNELTNKELAENLKMLIGAYEKQECPEDVRKYKKSLAYLEKVWKKRSKISEEKQKQEIQCLIRGYGLLDDEDSVEKKTEEEAAKIYTELLEMEQEDGNREMLYKKIAQLYEAAGRCDMAMDICIQGIGELKESQELKLMHIRFMCADPSVSREECSMKIKEYVRDDGQLPDQEEFKKLQKEYAIKMEGEEVWVGR